ncbi:MAG: M1 family metallopeptidase [Chitinophagaceae bacterium]|nr:M1 family metallopeptidase [Chitinophagaceae bacterium]
MKRISVLASLLFSVQIISAQQQTYWQQQVNYNIAVALNDKDHSLDGLEKITYTNNSPDTLKFIWFHLWPNAYKNDRTAFSEQLLINGRTDYYFSEDSSRGYINKLDFKVDEVDARIEAHPTHIDIVKLVLPKPLLPKQSIKIETPFHIKLPYNFSRGGHVLNDYQLTQWYPKPAVYDAKGWHEMPYLDQGEFYSEFGSFDVSITVPENYLVAATGELQTVSELELLKKLGKTKLAQQPNYKIEDVVVEKKSFFPAKPVKKLKPLIVTKPKLIGTKTLQYHQDNVHDFAWFASKNFLVQYDTLQLNDKEVDLFSFFPKKREKNSTNNIMYMKRTLKNYSNWLGEYPYKTATVVVGKQEKDDGMEYPTITYINTPNDLTNTNSVISHELGHIWLYGILASNERDHAWMDEGMNTYYDNKAVISQNGGLSNIFIALKKIHKNIPIDTASIAYPKQYYGLFVYEKAGEWMKELETLLGKNVFDSMMHVYYETWKFKHPYPQDFKNVIESVSGKNIDQHFNKLYSTSEPQEKNSRPIKTAFFFPSKETVRYNHISYLPTATYNFYDGIRLGAAIHNYQLPLPKFQFLINPSFGTSSSKLNFFGRASYNIYSKKSWLEIAASYQQFTYDNFISDAGTKFNLGIKRFVPSIKYTIYKSDLRSTERTVIGFKTFYLHQENLLFSGNKITTPSTKSYINRLYITKSNNRVLYPYHINLTIDQGEDFVRAGLTAKQFFNYPKNKGGIEARFFAGKFFYTKSKTFLQQYYTDKYHLNMSGPKGYEDYTYSDYFVGRGEFEGWKSQQIMERDGFFKARTDYLGNKVGKSDDWLMAANFNIDMPGFPTLKLFADIGTYAEAWVDNPTAGRFLFDAGIHLSLFNNAVNIYAPILFSKAYRDYNKSILGENIFAKTISFSINLQNLHFNKLSRDIPL